MSETIFSCPCGTVRGSSENGLYTFRGLPYAVTERFRSPVLIDSWAETAGGGEIDCWQYKSFIDESDRFYCKEFRSDLSFSFAESPMTLNIVTPAAEGKRPVLMFFHGGSFESGTVGELPYGQCTEYGKRDIVFVSAGYRLNVFGMHGGNNFGLEDQLTAIDWVRANISAFGGDPDRITLIGQSAGAMSIMDLLCSGELEGKICGAVMMSGAGVPPFIGEAFSREQVSRFWAQVDAEVGEDPQTASPEKLWRAWYKVKSSQNYVNGFKYMQPCIDGKVLKTTLREAVSSGRITDVPIMAGLTSQDCVPLFVYGMVLRLGLKCAKLGHKGVYGYFFDRTPPGNSYKAFHGADLWYLFGNLDKSWRGFEETDYRLCAQMIDAVASFCRTGDPGDPVWKAISPDNRLLRLYDGEHDSCVPSGFCRKKLLHTALRDPGPC